ncbi:glycosyltransferase family 9 protein [Streptomyces sp. NPDC045251]|uniref:glycosyltransferase family 9 protein n=1 Tax=unclassified Streptomyces TaxID=2593676 RepID=UPI0033E6F52C
MKALVARPGGLGDVLLAGPAVRAVATRATRVTMLCGARGAPAARLLPHVDDVVVWEQPGGDGADGLVNRLRAESYDVALVLARGARGSSNTTGVLRSARVRRIGALEGPSGLSEEEAALGAAAAMGFGLRRGDDGGLRVRAAPDTAPLTGNGPYVVVHPGAGDPGRAWEAGRGAAAVARLADAGHRVVVTGGPEEAVLTRRVAGDVGVDLGGRTDPRTFAGVLRAADALVTGSGGPARLAAAVGTPVVSVRALLGH